jgi:hypothetical protein
MKPVIAPTSLKLAPLSAVLLSQFVASDAGSVEAQHDARLCAVYGAYRTALKDGNKTQLMLVEAACAAYATPKACRALTTTPDKHSTAASRACAVYGAYKLALDACGIPALLKGATTEQAEQEASILAHRFVDIVTVALTPAQKAVKSDADKAADKAAKEVEQAKAAADAAAEFKVAVNQAAAKEAEKLAVKRAAEIAAANALTTPDMVQAVINAMRAGAVAPDLLALLSDALDEVAVMVETERVPVDAVAEEAATA